MYSADPIVESASLLRDRLIATHPPLAQRFRSGLPPEFARAMAGKHGLTLTNEATAFFSVIDGFFDPFQGPQAEVHLLHGRWFESLECAIQHYKWFWNPDFRTLDEVCPEFLIDDRSEVPPLRFMGEDSGYFYAFDLRAEGRPIWGMAREAGLSVAFRNLHSMLQTMNEWLEENLMTFDGAQWQLREGDSQEVVWRKWNSGTIGPL